MLSYIVKIRNLTRVLMPYLVIKKVQEEITIYISSNTQLGYKHFNVIYWFIKHCTEFTLNTGVLSLPPT